MTSQRRAIRSLSWVATLLMIAAVAGCGGSSNGQHESPTGVLAEPGPDARTDPDYQADPEAGSDADAGSDPDARSRRGPGTQPGPDTPAGPGDPGDPIKDTPEDLPGRKVISWIKAFGPMGKLGPQGVGHERGSPAGSEAYYYLADDQCEEALAHIGDLPEPSRSLYEGAASACLAAFHDQPDRWPSAHAGLMAVGPQTSRLNCLEKSVHQVLKSLVSIHEQAPDTKFVKDDKKGEETDPKCPQIQGLHPDHGPWSGGYEIKITGVNLPSTVGIHFGARYLTAVTRNGTEAVVTVPPAEATIPPGERQDGTGEVAVKVWVDGWPWGAEGTPSFTYQPVGQAESSPASSPPAGS
jgi:IPT/TIG domain